MPTLTEDFCAAMLRAARGPLSPPTERAARRSLLNVLSTAVSASGSAAVGVLLAVADESGRAGVREGHLAELFGQAGLGPVRDGLLTVGSRYASFEDWWEPLTLGIGPPGAYVAALADEDRAALREHCRDLLPRGPIEVTACAWAAACPP